MSHQCYEVDNKLSKSLKICDSLVTFFSKGRTPLPYPSMLGYTCLEEKTIMLNFAFQVLRKCLVDKIKHFVTILKFTFEHPTPPTNPTPAHLLLVFSRKQSTFDADVAPLPFQMGERNVFVCDALHSLDYQSIWSNPSTTNFDTNLSTLRERLEI